MTIAARTASWLALARGPRGGLAGAGASRGAGRRTRRSWCTGQVPLERGPARCRRRAARGAAGGRPARPVPRPRLPARHGLRRAVRGHGRRPDQGDGRTGRRQGRRRRLRGQPVRGDRRRRPRLRARGGPARRRRAGQPARQRVRRAGQRRRRGAVVEHDAADQFDGPGRRASLAEPRRRRGQDRLRRIERQLRRCRGACGSTRPPTPIRRCSRRSIRPGWCSKPRRRSASRCGRSPTTRRCAGWRWSGRASWTGARTRSSTCSSPGRDSAPPELTGFDLAYLSSLYRVPSLRCGALAGALHRRRDRPRCRGRAPLTRRLRLPLRAPPR